MIRSQLITVTGTTELKREATATIRAESWIESETTAVHSVVYADGSITVWSYTRGDNQKWTRDQSLAVRCSK